MWEAPQCAEEFAAKERKRRKDLSAKPPGSPKRLRVFSKADPPSSIIATASKMLAAHYAT